MNKYLILGTIVVILGAGTFFVLRNRSPKTEIKEPSDTPQFVEQLSPDKYPKVSLQFSSDAHYVTVNISNIHSNQLEYNLVYEATIKGNKIQTGVNAQANVSGQSTYSKKQLLGSESSGKFTYHTNIQNAVLELTLRDSSGRSLFTSTYPFSVSPGESVELTPY